MAPNNSDEPAAAATEVATFGMSWFWFPEGQFGNKSLSAFWKAAYDR